MSLASQGLPSDPDALRALAAELLARIAEKDLAIAARDAEIHRPMADPPAGCQQS